VPDRSTPWRGAAFARTPFTKRHLLCHLVWPKRVGSRRLPRTPQGLAALLVIRTETLGQKIAMGNSREPPAVTLSGHKT
jgi:hypothetical protein